MASTYGYITVANLEAYESTNYGNINATLYSDANVEAKITIAERIVNGLIGTPNTATARAVFVASKTSAQSRTPKSIASHKVTRALDTQQHASAFR